MSHQESTAKIATWSREDSDTKTITMSQQLFVTVATLLMMISACILTISRSAKAESRPDRVAIAVLANNARESQDPMHDLADKVSNTLDAICVEADVYCEFHTLPIRRATNYLRDGNIQGLVTVEDDLFRICCESSLWATPYFYGLYSFHHLDDIPRHEQNLRNKSLIVLNGSHSIDIMAPNLARLEKSEGLSLYLPNDASGAIGMFLRGRANYLWGPESWREYVQDRAGYKPVNYMPLITRPLTLWVHKDQRHVLQKMDVAFEKLLHGSLMDDRNLMQ